MSKINVDKDTLEDAQNKIIKYLYDAGYEGTLEEGTGLYDLLIKGFALVYTLMEQQTAKTKGYLSIAEADRIKNQLGDEYDHVIDSILSNWFVERKKATKPRITLRLFFRRPLEMLQLDPDKEYFKGYRLVFDYTFIHSSFTNHIRANALSEHYYVDVEVEAKEAGPAQVTPGDSLTVSQSISPYFMEARVLDITDYGKDDETSENFIERTQEVITTRELISHRAINTRLKDEFEAIQDIYIAGYGYPEQLRDLKYFEAAEVHVGNKADIYITGEHQVSKMQIEVEPETTLSEVTLPLEHTVTHILRVNKFVDLLGNVTREPLDYTLVNNGEEYSFASSKAELTIVFDEEQPEDTFIEIEYLYSNQVTSVQNYVGNLNQRVVNYDPWVKAFYPVVLTLDLEVHLDNALSVSGIEQEIVEYLRSLRHNKMYVGSKLASHLHSKFPEIKRIVTPMAVTYSVMDPETLETFTGTTQDYFSVDQITDPDKSLQLTHNTTEFYTDSERINITYV